MKSFQTNKIKLLLSTLVFHIDMRGKKPNPGDHKSKYENTILLQKAIACKTKNILLLLNDKYQCSLKKYNCKNIRYKHILDFSTLFEIEFDKICFISFY